MIGIILQQENHMYRIVVDGNDVKFTDGRLGKVSDISGLRLSKTGVIKEFPDLKYKDNWREEAIKRFKRKINSYKTEEEKITYIISDLKKYGFIPRYKQKQGYRVEVIK